MNSLDVVHQLNYSKIYNSEMQERILCAQQRDYYYDQDGAAIQYMLRKDLSPFFDASDLNQLNLLTVDSFIYAFLEKLCNVYDRPPVFQFTDSVGRAAKDRFAALMEEVRIHQVMQETFLRCRLHNTVLATVKWSKQLDRLFIENGYNIGNAMVVEHPEYMYDAALVAYETLAWDNKPRWIVWDREHGEHYATDGTPKWDAQSRTVTSEKIPIPPAGSTKAPAIWPWVAYHYKLQNDFWGNGLDGLLQLARSINVLLTVLNDDSIRETIRLLILSFAPAGTQGEKGQLKSGLTHPIYPESRVGNTTPPAAQVVSADLYTEQIIALIEKLTEIISSLHNIPNPLKSQMTDNLAGVTLRMKNEPLLQQWEKDQGIMRPYDKELIRCIVEVNNYYRPGKRIDAAVIDELTIVYSDPSIVTDEKSELEIEQLKWSAGLSSPVAYLQSKNPNMTSQDAEDSIRQNLEIYNELMGLKVQVMVPGAEKNLDGEEQERPEKEEENEDQDAD